MNNLRPRRELALSCQRALLLQLHLVQLPPFEVGALNLAQLGPAF